jgi:hypothetical protein
MTVAAVVVTYGVLFGNRTFPNNGVVSSIGVSVYWDAAGEFNVTEISWGYIEPGSMQNRTVYIKNPGTVPMTLNMTTNGWNPTLASSYIKLEWNREGFQINPQSMLETVLTLSVFSNITEIADFSFNMTIAGYDQ